MFKSTGGGAVVLREASEEGEEVVCVFGCDGRFDIICDFDPACDEDGWWSVAGVDGPESFVNGEGRFVRGPVTGLVEAAGERVPVFVIPWSAVFIVVVGYIEVNVVLVSEGALDLLEVKEVVLEARFAHARDSGGGLHVGVKCSA